MDKKILESSAESLRHPGQLISKLPKVRLSNAPILYVFRHGETYDNARRIFCGRRNSNLTPKGLDQAKVLAKRLKDSKIDLAISPPLIRTRRTMKEVLKYHTKTKIEEEPLLIESLLKPKRQTNRKKITMAVNMNRLVLGAMIKRGMK